jgi:hypothetical protein
LKRSSWQVLQVSAPTYGEEGGSGAALAASSFAGTCALAASPEIMSAVMASADESRRKPFRNSIALLLDVGIISEIGS